MFHFPFRNDPEFWEELKARAKTIVSYTILAHEILPYEEGKDKELKIGNR